MEQDRLDKMRKTYRRQTIPKDEARVRLILPSIRDSCLKLYEVCTCTPKEGKQVRPASETDEEYFVALADLFRCYRWLVGISDVENVEMKEKYARLTIEATREGIDVIESVVPFLEPSAAHPWIRVAVTIRDAMTCGMQALANCLRNSPNIQNLIWPEFFEIIGSLITLEEDKLLNCICAVIMNCLTDARLDEIVDRGYAARIFERISFFGAREDSLVAFEAIFDLSGHLLQCPLVAQGDFDLLPLSARCAILDLISSSFAIKACRTSTDDEGLQQSLLPSFWPVKIAEEFKSNCMCLTRLKDPSPAIDEECELILKTLDLLGNITASDDLRQTVVTDTLLLDRVIELFVGIEEIGKTGENLFSPVLKMADVKPQELITPSRGIKSQLLRLLANLVYENPAFEQRARQTDLLGKLKNNTKIDYRNPYVQQWAILAIRNLHFSAAFEEIRREQEDAPSGSVPSVAHSVDGDLIGERKLWDGLMPHRIRGFQHSHTVEALDLHTSFNESHILGADGALQSKHTSGSSRKQHKNCKSQRRPSETFDQDTQTLAADETEPPCSVTP